MLISLVNRSGRHSDEKVQEVVRAINRQIDEDFTPYWSFGARVRLEGAVGKRPNTQSLADMRGDAVIYLWDKVNLKDALGYHDTNFRGIPYGFVFTDLSENLGEAWTVTLSHEVLELLGDSQANLLVQGPHPLKPRHTVFHWFEMCDAVQDETYAIDGIEVSNFVLPSYFTEGEQEGARNDFLGRVHKKGALKSFGINPGGYVGFYDPALKDNDQVSAPADKRALKRLAVKAAAGSGRGHARRVTLKRSGGIGAIARSNVRVRRRSGK